MPSVSVWVTVAVFPPVVAFWSTDTVWRPFCVCVPPGPATVASCVMAYERGASVFRVHDVAAVADALKVADATVAGWPTTSPRTTRTT